jgi:alkylhydroperoxidase family enzyme
MARNWTDVFHTGARWSRRAETLTLISETHAPEEICQDIAAHFTEKEMVDPTIAISLMNVFNRIAIGFGCDPTSS